MQPSRQQIIHLAYTNFPSDPRVRRAATVAAQAGSPVVVVAIRLAGQAPVQRIGQITVVRIPGRKSRGGFLSYLMEYTAFTWRCRRLLTQHRQLRQPSVVHVHTLPDFLVWSALPLRRRGTKVILDLHEIFPEFAGSKFPGVIGRVLTRLAVVIERWARAHSDATITVNQPIARLLMGRSPRTAPPPLIIHNTPDPADFGDLRVPTPTSGGTLRCVYHGTLTALYGLDVAIGGVVTARRAGVAVHLTIVGDGPDRPSLVALVKDLRAEDTVSFADSKPPLWLQKNLPAYHAGIVPTRMDGMTRYSLSNKLLEYIHLGIPVIAARLPSYEEYFAETAAWFWAPNDPQALARTLEEFARAPQSERLARARQAQQTLEVIGWSRERARLNSLYVDLSQASEATMKAKGNP